ncbi:MAG: 3-hydroxyanthranilate 3,4-dioxygenase, partial [Bacteroidota bacterium]
LPPRVPHSPIRAEASVGIVIERKRREGEKDGLLWFCDNCNHKLYEEYFVLTNIENDFQPVFRRFYADEEARTCNNCGTVMATDERFV